MIFRRCGSQIHQVSFLKKQLYCAGLFMIACLMAFSLMIYDYFQLKQTQTGKASVPKQIVDQQTEITRQHKQIQLFASEINTLKTKLISLNDFEKSIRTIANIAQPDKDAGLSGIGGSMPEDLSATVSLGKHQDSLMRAMHEQVANLHRASDRQYKEFETILRHLEEKQNILASTPSILPAEGRISSGFGYRISPFTGRSEMHKGLDVAALRGEPIHAAADGVVSFVGKKRFFGNMIVIDHGHGVSTRYAHCDTILMKDGDAVQRGDVVAQIGNTGRSTGPHLHYEVRLNGVQVNPKKYIMNMVVDKGLELKVPAS